MRVRKAERFERALQQAERGQEIEPQFQPLVQVAWQAAALAEPSPPPPYGLSPGRQRFLAEAGLMRGTKSAAQSRQIPFRGVLRVTAALMTMILLVGLALGGGQVVADSLPGELLYGVKLTAAEIRLDLTADPQARAKLTLALAEERLDELAELMQQGRPADDPTLAVVEHHLATALQAAVGMEDSTAVRALQRVEASIQLRQQTMAEAMTGVPQAEQMRLQQTLRAMEQVRQDAHTGQGDPDDLRQRLRHGAPSTPASQPHPSDTPQPSPSPEPRGGGPTDQPEAGPGANPSPTCQPDRLRPTSPAGRGPDPSPQPTDRPEPAEPSGQGPGPRPTDKLAVPRPTDCPDPTSQPGGGPGPGPQPSKEPSQPEPTQLPESSPQPTEERGDPGPGPQPPEEPGQPEPPGGSGPGPRPQPPDGNGGGGKGKP